MFESGADGPTGHGILVSPPPGASREFGGAAAIADVDGDGFGDLTVTDPSGGNGAAFGFPGSTTGLDPESDWMSTVGASTNGCESFGHETASVGDTNGDGYQAAEAGGGVVWVFLGAPTGPFVVAIELAAFEPGDQFCASMPAAETWTATSSGTSWWVVRRPGRRRLRDLGRHGGGLRGPAGIRRRRDRL